MASIDGVDTTPDEIREAERSIRLATRTAVYRTTEAGTPSDSKVRAAFDEARDEQIRAIRLRHAADEATRGSASLSPLGRPLASASIEGASWTAEGSASVIPARYSFEAGSICSAAFEILFDAGIFNAAVRVYG